MSAAANVAFQVLYSFCLACGPVSLTVLVVNFSVLIPTLFSAVVFKEEIFITQLFGIIFLVVSMLLSVRKTQGERGVNKKWFILTIVALFSTGIAACIQKYFYKTELAHIENASNTFLFLVYVIGTVLTFFIQFLRGKTGKKEKCTSGFVKKILPPVLLIGLIISVFQ
jgi:drug/metabolite transporter (DMT)-like permease